jgi:superfamily II DNA helicase RecQ
MRFQLFQYALPTDPALPDLNTFLGVHRVTRVSHHVANHPAGALLVFVVETVGPAAVRPDVAPASPKVDYREVLTAEEFAVYSRLRSERKRVADAEGVPVYTVLTNAQLAAIVRGRVTTPAQLSSIEGVGKARIEKYASLFLPIVQEMLPGAAADE